MKLFLSQFRILFWKNWLLKKRHAYLTFLEIFLPLISSFMMVITISSIDPKKSIKRQPISRIYERDTRQGIIEFPNPVYNLRENLNALSVRQVQLQFYYTPASKCTLKFMSEIDKEFQSHMGQKSPLEYRSLEHDWQMDTEFSQVKNNHTVMVGLIFHSACDNDYPNFLKNFTVTIRALGPNTINFKARFPDKLVMGPSNQTFYTEMFGFLESQNFVSMAYLNAVSGIQGTKKKLRVNNVIMRRYPYVASASDR